MREASYALIRYNPDPGRNETLNIGILVWDQSGYRLRVDREAVNRVVRENPHLERDALLYVEPYLHKHLGSDKEFTEQTIIKFIERQSGFPILISEPRLTTVFDEQSHTLEDTLDRLVERMVHPKRRGFLPQPHPAKVLEKRLNYLIKQKSIFRNYFFELSRTGVPRVTDFYRNSGRNVALDALQLSLKKGDDIRLRADAEAFKVEDVLQANPNIQYVVYCEFSNDEAVAKANSNAKKVLESVGARVTRDLEEAVRELGGQQ
jgi:hypothetical protein